MKFKVIVFVLLNIFSYGCNAQGWSVAIYYSAERGTKLTEKEQEKIEYLVKNDSLNLEIIKAIESGKGNGAENFSFYDLNPNSKIILEGSTKLPLNGKQLQFKYLFHWCGLLSEIRKSIRGAHWSLQVENTAIPWNEKAQKYECTSDYLPVI